MSRLTTSYQTPLEIQNDAREETRFRHAQQEAQEVEGELRIRAIEPRGDRSPMDVPGEHERRRDDAPGDHDARNPHAGTHTLQDDIAGHFENEVSDKEDTRAETINLIAKLEVARHLQLRETHIHTVQKRKDVAQEYEGDESSGDPFKGRLFELRTHRRGHGNLALHTL